MDKTIKTIHENKNDLEQFYINCKCHNSGVSSFTGACNICNLRKKEINNVNNLVYTLDRFTILPNGEALEDLDGEYVLFSSVLNLFAPKNK